ncbi:hypothetical protein KFU94_39225 [Chloroflexi bacterium TSY]|nr:hypothetical protein [Chloroflexi bacterium TSY]
MVHQIGRLTDDGERQEDEVGTVRTRAFDGPAVCTASEFLFPQDVAVG